MFCGGSDGHIVCAMPQSGHAHYELPVTTTLDLPGHETLEVVGTCFGLVVRSMGFGKSIGASFRQLRSGEVPQYTELLEDSRRQAIDRMVDNARLLGANAILAMRFDSSEIGQSLTEIVAYGTAARVAPIASGH